MDAERDGVAGADDATESESPVDNPQASVNFEVMSPPCGGTNKDESSYAAKLTCGTKDGSIQAIRLLESKREDYITVARNGKPVARITLINETPASKRIGIRKGKFSVQGDFDADNREIEEMLAGGAL